jgi:signal peptidase I
MSLADELAVQLLRRGAPLRVKARGASMLPFLYDGDVALVVPADGTEIGLGDVVCYETSPGRFFMHRVIERTRDRFVAKGDALAFTDLIGPEQVVGKVVAVERRGRIKRFDTRIGRWRNRAIARVSSLVPFTVAVAIAIPVRRILRAALRG